MEKPTRLLALDAFRGLTIAAMILVNTPGSWSHVYAPLRHAAWHGCTPTDLIFPFFLYITGVAMWFALGRFRELSLKPALPKIARRAALIFLIGLALNAFPFNRDFETLRYLGVLQRIGLAYGLAAVLCLSLSLRTLLITAGALLLGYWLMLASYGTDPYSLEFNLVRRFDLTLLGASHLYQGTGIAFDPEGLLSTLPAVVSVITGYGSGAWIVTHREDGRMVSGLLWLGAGSLVAGLLWGLVFPINKQLWTSSYVLLTTGLAQLCLGACLWLIDERGYRRWSFPAVVLGTNSLFAYVLSILWILTYIRVLKFEVDGVASNAYSWLYTTIFQPLAGPLNGSLLFALTHALLFWLIVWQLYRRRIFIKI